MSKYNWKDKYYDYTGLDIFTHPSSVEPVYFSLLGNKKGNGTKDNPYSPYVRVGVPGNTNLPWVISGGSYAIHCPLSNAASHVNVIGQGKKQTAVDVYVTCNGGYVYMLDMTINFIQNMTSNVGCTLNIKNCIIKGSTFRGIENVHNSVIRYDLMDRVSNCSANTLVGLTLLASRVLKSNYSVLEDCSVSFTQADITGTYRNNYLGFNNCKFMIGDEEEYLPLDGETAEEQHASFLERCREQGITPPNTADLGVSSPLGRWLFSKNSIAEEYIIEGSEMDNFQQRLFINLGHSGKKITRLPVTTQLNTPYSFNPGNPRTDKLILGDNSLHLDPSVLLNERNKLYIESNIIWLGSKQKLTEIDILHNLPMDYGVFIDNTNSLSEQPVSIIEPNKNYLLRSSDKQPASIEYNDTVYTTSLTDRNNVFRGMEGIVEYNVLSGNPAIYEVLDYTLYHTIELRVVDEIPSDKITGGSLLNGYWYFVAPDNLGDTGGSVIYNGTEYSCFGSFLVKNTLTFSINGNCHLRRCWSQDYSVNDAQDKSFWQNKQKPLWNVILPNDLRCLMQGDSPYTIEMKMDAEGRYITSGHPEFYKSLTGEAGFMLPSFDITGTFMQIRLSVNTLNPV